MSEEQTQALSLVAAYAFGAAHDLATEVEGIRQMSIRWAYPSRVRRGLMVELFEKHGVFEEFKRQHWALGNTPLGATRRAQYLRHKQAYEEARASGSLPPRLDDPDAEERETDQAVEFAMEAHLRDFLARNLDRIEQGLRLYHAGERKGVEFPVDGGRIDLLAIDRTGKFVVIELKLSQGRNKALGQLLYYMGWVDQHLGNGPCRGYIIASEITDELAVAVSRVPAVSLAKYRMSFSIDPVSAPTLGTARQLSP